MPKKPRGRSPTWKRTSRQIFCATTCAAATNGKPRMNSMPPRAEDRSAEEAVGGGFTPKADGGNEQHPIHDEDQEDAAPEDYEHEIDRLDDADRARSR